MGAWAKSDVEQGLWLVTMSYRAITIFSSRLVATFVPLCSFCLVGIGDRRTGVITMGASMSQFGAVRRQGAIDEQSTIGKQKAIRKKSTIGKQGTIVNQRTIGEQGAICEQSAVGE